MKTKAYANVFEEAKKHPKAKAYLNEARARIRLAEALYEERSSQFITMAELAERAGTTPAVISRIENAQVSAGIDLIYKIFKALGKKELNLILG
ncbi:helix-turn-helix domain-containing protein [Candidatus Peregrinibacteria bacterium]|nr:helix-turn-helix domain-containing protein [Candidatus Peregrinibacteria bacterium]